MHQRLITKLGVRRSSESKSENHTANQTKATDKTIDRETILTISPRVHRILRIRLLLPLSKLITRATGTSLQNAATGTAKTACPDRMEVGGTLR